MVDRLKLESATNEIESACESFVVEEIDFDELKGVMDALPRELWEDSEAVYSMLKIPMCDEGMYDIAVDEMDMNIAELVCALAPDCLWESGDGVLTALRLISDYSSEYSEEVYCSDFEAALQHATPEMWKNRTFATRVIDVVAGWARGIVDLNCIDELIPTSFYEDEHDVHYVLSALCSANNLNAAEFYLFPEATWQYPDEIIWILQNLEDELSYGGFTMYPAFGGSKEEYLSRLIGYFPESLKSDVDFVLEFLRHEYFSDAYHVVYDWIDPALWANKEFVIPLLEELDVEAIGRVSDELREDEEFKKFAEENYG